MSLDLTGGLIVSFLLDELRPVLGRHPRYRDNDGQTFQTFSNLIQYRDVSATIGNLRGTTTRLSPDLYLGTAWARALVAQTNGKPGTFIEWLQEIDPTQATPVAGMYLLAVDQVDEQARQARFIYTHVRTLSGSVENADGTVIVVNPAIPLALVQPTDDTIQLTKAGTKMWLNHYTASISLVRSDTSAALLPGVDWWLERTVTLPLGTTRGGAQYLLRPDGISSLALLNASGQVLSRGADWNYTGDGRLLLAPHTPAGQVYSARGLMRLDPRTNPLIHPENTLPITLAVDETLAAGTLAYCTPSGNYTEADTITVGGSPVLQQLLTPGDDLRWEACTNIPQTYVSVGIGAMTTTLIPGLNLAVGRTLEVGDQCAILVHPNPAEAYQIYGGKDNLSFDLTIKSNDLTTSSELANLARGYLLVQGRDRMESAGITMFDSSYSYGGEQRDASGTAVSHSVVLSFNLAADWELYAPIITSISAVDINLEVTMGTVTPMVVAGARTPFIASYF